MLIFTLTGVITWLGKIIPKTIIRGVQFGLGMQLCLLSFKDYIPADKTYGYIVAFIAFCLGLVFIGNKKYPPAIFILLLGLVYALLVNTSVFQTLEMHFPAYTLPTISLENILAGFLLLALPQIPLSLGNSIFATNQLVKDYFPEKNISVKKIGLTYSLMNIISSLLGGIPTCHGSGGIAGHYTFGARTGGSTLIYGLFYVVLGLFFSLNPSSVFQLFPKPILGVILLFEGVALILMLKDIITDKRSFFIAVLVGLIANGLPYGYLIGMIVGTGIYYIPKEYVLKYYGKIG
jgi:MFS superfamily sulfate permease-like transporter